MWTLDRDTTVQMHQERTSSVTRIALMACTAAAARWARHNHDHNHTAAQGQAAVDIEVVKCAEADKEEGDIRLHHHLERTGKDTAASDTLPEEH